LREHGLKSGSREHRAGGVDPPFAAATLKEVRRRSMDIWGLLGEQGQGRG